MTTIDPETTIDFAALDEAALRRNPELLAGWLRWYSGLVCGYADKWTAAGNEPRPSIFTGDLLTEPRHAVQELARLGLLERSPVLALHRERLIRGWIGSKSAAEVTSRRRKARPPVVSVGPAPTRLLTLDRNACQLGARVTVRNAGEAVVRLRAREHGGADYGPLEPGETRTLEMATRDHDLYAVAEQGEQPITVLSIEPVSRREAA